MIQSRQPGIPPYSCQFSSLAFGSPHTWGRELDRSSSWGRHQQPVSSRSHPFQFSGSLLLDLRSWRPWWKHREGSCQFEDGSVRRSTGRWGKPSVSCRSSCRGTSEHRRASRRWGTGFFWTLGFGTCQRCGGWTPESACSGRRCGLWRPSLNYRLSFSCCHPCHRSLRDRPHSCHSPTFQIAWAEFGRGLPRPLFW